MAEPLADRVLQKIRKYPTPFARFYGHMNERMDGFAHIDTFEHNHGCREAVRCSRPCRSP